MRKNLPNIGLFILLAAGLTFGWWYIDKNFIPPPKPPQTVETPTPKSKQPANLALAGGWIDMPRLFPNTPIIKKDDTQPEAEAPATPYKRTPPELIPLGEPGSYISGLLTTEGGGVQQLILTRFDEANRIGTQVMDGDQPQKLRLIPGVDSIRDELSLTEIHESADGNFTPKLKPGKVPESMMPILAQPSYQLLHYPDLKGDYPSAELGRRQWEVVERSINKVVFKTKLATQQLEIFKTFTLNPKDYHLGFEVRIVPMADRPTELGKFRYQIAGARNLPVEGEWYTSTYKNVLSGWVTKDGNAERSFSDSRTIHREHGSDAVLANKSERTFTYAAVVTQYFASALCIDESVNAEGRPRGLWDYVRGTREPKPGENVEQAFLSDITVRAVATPVDFKSGEPITHHYLIYNGPAKIRLLRQLEGDNGVNEALVERYHDTLTLRTLTDFHSPTFFGRVANFLYWSELIIRTTNLMHMVLGWLNGIVPIWGINIIILTIMVRMILLIPSRKQQIMMKKMQDKMAEMKPEIDKLQEKHKDNPQLFQQEKTKLMFRHGVNPLSTMSGCLLLFAQMPIFMGLYFCLQESVFFRLEHFLWVPNLAAPDMLIWWGEGIPYISTPNSMGSFFYLGPFFNILPILAVTLIMIQQKLTMPPPTDEQQAMQQKMMKFMMFGMALFFYKVAAGLCIYFICSTAWALAERLLLPKPTPKPPGERTENDVIIRTGEKKPEISAVNGQPGFFGRLRAKVEALQEQAREQNERQIRNDPNMSRDKKKKRKR